MTKTQKAMLDFAALINDQGDVAAFYFGAHRCTVREVRSIDLEGNGMIECEMPDGAMICIALSSLIAVQEVLPLD